MLGKVGLANPLGSNVLKSPAMLPFLHLLLPEITGSGSGAAGVASWWCVGNRKS
ncbi:MAG: hypothetical protein IPM37_22825 [Hahellaceae bacterium]|nr:hypothetical protein [Hahellaceae bacterium]